MSEHDEKGGSIGSVWCDKHKEFHRHACSEMHRRLAEEAVISMTTTPDELDGELREIEARVTHFQAQTMSKDDRSAWWPTLVHDLRTLLDAVRRQQAEIDRLREEKGHAWYVGHAVGLEKAQDELADLRALVNVPGQWVCDNCNLVLTQQHMNVASGSVGVPKVQPLPECPNGCSGTMRPQTWKEACEQADKALDEMVPDLRARVERAEKDRKGIELLLLSGELDESIIYPVIPNEDLGVVPDEGTVERFFRLLDAAIAEEGDGNG